MAQEEFNPTEHPHTRFNPLLGSWVLVSPHRMKRPWMGQIENFVEESIPEFDPQNPLCPGVKRPNGQVNPKYKTTFSFDNDFPAMLENAPPPPESDDPLFRAEEANGTCRVLCFHPKSNITLPLMTDKEVEGIVHLWIQQQAELGKKWKWVQIFENRGAVMGCSNPHPHCQIWASSFLPNDPRSKHDNQLKYYQKYDRPMLLDYVERELVKRERIVSENNDWVVLVPYWALWPFETMILPKTHIKRMTDISKEKAASLALIMKDITTRYDNLFQCSFPYSMGWHGAPTGDMIAEESTHWVLHAVYYPPLLRSATVKKFMVGYELLAQGQRDLTPEQAAKRLRDLPNVHFKMFS